MNNLYNSKKKNELSINKEIERIINSSKIQSIDENNNQLNKEKEDNKDKSFEQNKPIFNTTSDKLRKVLPPGVHPKDLRTMLATWTAGEYLKGKKETEDPKEFNKLRNEVGDYVCKILGNQRTMALNSYIDPSVFQSHSPKGYTNWSESQKED